MTTWLANRTEPQLLGFFQFWGKATPAKHTVGPLVYLLTYEDILYRGRHLAGAMPLIPGQPEHTDSK